MLFRKKNTYVKVIENCSQTDDKFYALGAFVEFESEYPRVKELVLKYL